MNVNCYRSVKNILFEGDFYVGSDYGISLDIEFFRSG